MDPIPFIHLIAPAAKRMEMRTGVLASASIALAAYKTNWGSSCPGFNLYQIEAGADWHGAVVLHRHTKLIDGKPVQRVVTLRAYPNWDASIEDHATHVLVSKLPLDRACAEQLASIVEQYELKQFDSDCI